MSSATPHNPPRSPQATAAGQAAMAARRAAASGHAPYGGRANAPERRQPQRMNNGTRPPRPRKQKKSGGSKALMILLDITIVALIIAGLFFYLYPKWINQRQVDMRDKILASMKEDPGKNVSFEIGADQYKVPGERLEDWSTDGGEDFVNQIELNGGKVTVTYIGRLVIAKINCDIPLSPVADAYHLRFGAGILSDSAPLASPGQTAIFGHRFSTKGRDFNRLDEIDTGDNFFIDIAEANTRYHYRVDKQLIIPAADLPSYVWIANNVAPGYSPDDNTVLLVTCHPLIYGARDERLLIYAHLESTEPIKK